jgi:hypothetical protein
LIIGNPQGNTIIVSPEPNMAASVGISLGANTGPLILTLKDHGSLVTKAWYANATAGNPVIMVIEGIDNGYCESHK